MGIKLGPFSERSGVGYKTLANVECGHQKTVSIEVVYLIARGLGMSEDDAMDLLAEPDRAAA